MKEERKLELIEHCRNAWEGSKESKTTISCSDFGPAMKEKTKQEITFHIPASLEAALEIMEEGEIMDILNNEFKTSVLQDPLRKKLRETIIGEIKKKYADIDVEIDL